MVWVKEATSKEDARRILQRANTETNFKRMWKLKQRPCTDCGLRWHPYTMTFDHVDRKSMKYHSNGTKPVNIGECLYWKPEVFNMQLKLLDVVCRNCHMVREAKRDINNPKISYRNRRLFPMWFEKCKGALVKNQSLPAD